MDTKVTPGPWEAVDSMTIRGPFERGNPEKPGFFVASLPASRSEGDSRLIASAPELLDALIVLRERHQIDDPHHAHLCEFCKQADAAIAKATGGKQ